MAAATPRAAPVQRSPPLSLRSQGGTLIAAAHRLSAITPNADHVVVFKAGSVAEQGTHTALLAHDGEYRRLWRAQEQER